MDDLLWSYKALIFEISKKIKPAQPPSPSRGENRSKGRFEFWLIVEVNG
jgi:hypothetical protein